MVDAPENDQKLRELSDAAAMKFDSDVMVYNFELQPPADFQFMAVVGSRPRRRKNVILILTTEGGQADSAFRMMRFLQSRYERVTVVVTGWCKSAGTLMCIGAHEIMMGDRGELGPLDVQIVKADEMDEQKSGLVAEAAFEKLQQEAFKFFMAFVRDIGASEYRVTLKTASDIASKMATGALQPIFDKLDPVTIGEDYRSNRLAQAYAERLNSHSKNLRRTRDFDGLENLLSGYPEHGFVIDAKEASELFRNVKPLPAEIVEVVRYLGVDALWPRNSRRDQTPRMEFLNHEPDEPNEAGQAAVGGNRGGPRRPREPRPGNGAGELPRNS